MSVPNMFLWRELKILLPFQGLEQKRVQIKQEGNNGNKLISCNMEGGGGEEEGNESMDAEMLP
jgi:hypothetical protein